MRLQHLIFVYLAGFTAASPVIQTPSNSSTQSSLPVDAEDFEPDWDAVETDYNAALLRAKQDPTLIKRLNTEGANDVSYGLAIYAAGAAAIKQIKGLSKWKPAREKFVQICTQTMMDHNPNPQQAVAAICYNNAYAIQDPKRIYGLRRREIAVWPAKSDYDCFYMGTNNTFWSQGDGGTVNLYTRYYTDVCRFDDQSDLYC
ncbi:hypothetical protein LZ30DRAFT_666851 [Colletotrichum cereale]|nr:hypothetical protein LZ30DRAFT_666851 [Colletotrichum cereale]